MSAGAASASQQKGPQSLPLPAACARITDSGFGERPESALQRPRHRPGLGAQRTPDLTGAEPSSRTPDPLGLPAPNSPIR